jgi:hypothetical protein
MTNIKPATLFWEARQNGWQPEREQLHDTRRTTDGPVHRDGPPNEPPPNDNPEPQVNRESALHGGHTTGPTSPTLFDPWDDPLPPEFPGGVLAREMEDTVFAAALRDGVCPGALAMAFLAAASGATNKAARFAPYGNTSWFVPPIIWVMTIADSGQRKTAIEDLAFASLREVHANVWREHQKTARKWASLSAKEKRETAKPEEPHSFIVEDVTVEKLQQILAANNRGTFMCRDEMAGLLEFGRYTNGAGASERAFYLQAYEGGHYTVSRLSRDSFHIECAAVTIYGSIQPERLADFPDLSKDGLLQRMNMVRCSPASASRGDVSVKGMDQIGEDVAALTRMGWHRYITTPEGSQLIRQTEIIGRQLATVPDFGQGFQGTCSKLHGTHARYAMVLHLLTTPQAEIIAADTVERAGRLVHQFLLPQARDFFSSLSGSGLQRLRDIAGWVLTKANPRILASDLSAGVWTCRGMTTKQINEALDPLVAGGWLTPESHFPNNRAWKVNHDLSSRFAARTEAERVRREQAREFVRNIGKAKS